ncbi:MAG TPA: PAS domain S-box protein, partial [Candidatus Wunengus sp. YC61]|uniref:PAS domain S-box protein n=1 Tax=Candidatus Wunengus sp. YC61 TaxID=3367698 RepID=UPI004024C165
FRIFHKDGSVRIIHEKGVVTFDHAGRAIRMIGTAQDITERKRAAEELNTEKNKFLAVINTMEDGLTIQDFDYNIIYQNETVKNVFGVRLGEKCYSAYEGKNSICDGCPVEMAYKDGKSHVSERRVVLPSGEIAFYENIANPIIGAGGKIVSCLEISRNITDRKQAEEGMHLLQTIIMEISVSKDLYEALIVMIRKVCDAAGWVYGEAWMPNPDGTLLERNHAYYSSIGGFEKFSAITEGMTFPSGIGLPGRAWSMKQPVWVRDVILDPDYLRAPIAREVGLKTGIAFPVTDDNEIVAVIVFYNIKVEERNERLIKLVLAVLSQVGSIIRRKKAEDALRQSEEKLRSILDNATAVIYIKDVQGRYLFINKQFEKLFRLTRNAVKGETDFDLWSKEMAEAFQANDRRVIESKIPIEFEEAAPREDGLHTYISVKFPLFDSTGAVYAVCGISTDITRRKQMEDQLRTLSYTVEQSSVPIVITNTHGDIQYVNPMFTRLTGYSMKEAIGKNPRILKSGKTPPEIYKQLWDTITKGDEWHGEFCNKKKNGELYWEYAHISSIKDPMGRITNFVGIIEDITERRQMEEVERKLREQLYHVQKLESVGTLAGGIAHDFNNILTAIIGYANLVQMEMKEDVPSRDFVQKILNSAEKAAHLTQGLLAFSRKQISSPRPVYLNEIIKGVKSLLVRVMREDIEIKATLTDKECVLLADVGQMEQVLMNLATNARDAMPKGGVLSIITDIVEVDNEFIKAHGYGEVGRYALVSVSDTGEGMDEKTKEKIFEPFFTTKELGKGTGLGLAIVYGIIKQHNGYINVYSEPGKGTTFRIYLPLVETEVERKKPEVHVVHMGGTETILIAEDDEDIRKLTKTVLEGHGYTIREA